MTSDWPAAQPVLVDELLLLRGGLPEDADRVYVACQDTDIQHFTQVPVPYLREHAELFVAQGPPHWSTRQSAGFAITDRISGELLGACGLLGVDHATRQTGAGYWVAPWARSRGVARRALVLVTTWALGAGGFERVFVEVEEANPASSAVALAAGFTRADAPVEPAELKGTTRYFITYERFKTRTA
jgi:RimJ/RimL family protein N-acetyltransferase